MKHEEAISLLGWFKSKTNREDDLEAIDMAIKALQGGGGDLISRDDAIRELNGACSTWEDDAKVQEIVMAIPSAEQVAGKLNNPCDSLLKADSDECKEQKSKLDLISRADAIEAVRMSEHRITIADEQGGVGTVKWDMWGVYTAEAVEAIKALPSAEAVSREEYDHLEALYDAVRIYDSSAEAVQIPIKLEKRYPESKDEDITDAFMRGYLAGRSSAEAVQGEWIHDGQNFKGGLDWCHCSECGYKTSANGLSVYRFCPNCGARMKGGEQNDD